MIIVQYIINCVFIIKKQSTIKQIQQLKQFVQDNIEMYFMARGSLIIEN